MFQQTCLPECGTSAQHDNHAHATGGRNGIARIFDRLESTEVSVDIQIEIELAGRTVDHAEVASGFEVADDFLDGNCVRLLGVGVEATDLGNCHSDVDSSVA